MTRGKQWTSKWHFICVYSCFSWLASQLQLHLLVASDSHRSSGLTVNCEFKGSSLHTSFESHALIVETKYTVIICLNYVLGKLSSMKLIPLAKTVGEHCTKCSQHSDDYWVVAWTWRWRRWRLCWTACYCYRSLASHPGYPVLGCLWDFLSVLHSLSLFRVHLHTATEGMSTEENNLCYFLRLQNSNYLHTALCLQLYVWKEFVLSFMGNMK